MKHLTNKEITYVAGLLTFAKLEKRLYFTRYGNKVLDKMLSIVREDMNGTKSLRSRRIT